MDCDNIYTVFLVNEKKKKKKNLVEEKLLKRETKVKVKVLHNFLSFLLLLISDRIWSCKKISGTKLLLGGFRTGKLFPLIDTRFLSKTCHAYHILMLLSLRILTCHAKHRIYLQTKWNNNVSNNTTRTTSPLTVAFLSVFVALLLSH